MQHVITIANHKGGVGKTTTALNLAVGLSLIERKINPGNPERVLFIPLDAQGDGSQMLAGDFLLNKPEIEIKTSEIFTISELLIDDEPPHPIDVIKSAVLPNGFGEGINNLDYVPVNPGKQNALEKNLGGAEMGEVRVKEMLQYISNVYKYVVIDTPPNFSVCTMNALYAATELIIPVIPDAAHLHFLQDIMNSYAKVKKRWNEDLYLLGILPTRYDTRSNESRIALEELNNVYKEKMFAPIVTRADIRWAFGQGIDIFSLKPPRAGSDDFVSENEGSKEMGVFVKEAFSRMFNRDNR